MSPKLPGDSRRERQQAQNKGTWLALFFVMLCVGGFIGLISLIMPDFAKLLTVFAGFCFFLSFHYFTWGHWLIAKTERMKAEEAEK
ncbi:hypothetical protein [Thalassoglobus polymorphus]|uniref:Uncharacterized protein n=1 Tax=Thalassoglobus polymorphus TaxID=2527994 RepID=A0A517QRF7_9PLAN|nr:hypothetical protein [Thalassoglobus polymorphus]QDT34185.1 hypothetical protein Mal48_34450 [Thalassoglobus polymorphus]